MPFAGAASACSCVELVWPVSGAGSHRSSGTAKRRASAGRGSSSCASPASFRRSERYTRCLVTASTPKPEGGARCVSSARRDLYGGRLATAVPTVTIIGEPNEASLLSPGFHLRASCFLPGAALG